MSELHERLAENSERLARMEEGGRHRDSRLADIVDDIKEIKITLGQIRDAHIANAGAMKAHKFWVGGIAAAVSGCVAVLAKYLPLTGGFPR